MGPFSQFYPADIYKILLSADDNVTKYDNYCLLPTWMATPSVPNNCKLT